MKFAKCVKKFLMKTLLEVADRLVDYLSLHVDLLDLPECECEEVSNDE